MNDIRSRLERLGRIEPEPGLDARISSLIARAEAAPPVRKVWSARLPVLLAAGAVSLVLAFTAALLLRGPVPHTSVPPRLTVELPLTPGLERLLRSESPERRPFFQQYLDEVKIVYVAGSPARADQGTR